MDRNSFLAVGLSMLVFTTWIMWKSSQLPPEGQQPVPVAEAPAPSPTPPTAPAVPSAPGQAPTAPTPTPSSTPAPAIAQPPEMDGVPEWSRTFDTRNASVTLTNLGATVTDWTLTQFEEHQEQGNIPVRLVESDWPGVTALATRFESLGLGDLSQVLWSVESQGHDSATFAYRASGVTVRKTYSFDAEGYGFRLAMTVENGSGGNVSPRFRVEWPARVREGQDFYEQSLATLTEGSVERVPVAGIGSPGFFGDLFGASVNEPMRDVEWTGLDTKYFLAALLPDRTRDAVVTFAPIETGKSGAWLLEFEPAVLPPGQSLTHDLRGFVGPKIQDDLLSISETLELSVNRGWSWIAPLTRFFEWFLHVIYTVIPNYGLAIILLTVLVRIVTIPIMSKQMKSMERMRQVQPMLKELQEKHADDRQKQSEEMMALYKREGVNPLGGCLPMLLQFPVFIGLFYALQSSFDLRHADFFAWINDLSAPESLFTIPGLDLPFRVLPLIMGASMVLQQKITPTTIDPAQARMMMVMMPVMFTVLFYQFPSGLVLYWMVSNLLGIAHQLWVGKRMKATS